MIKEWLAEELDTELPVVTMAKSMGIHGRFYLHPDGCIDLETGKHVDSSVTGVVVDAEFLRDHGRSFAVFLSVLACHACVYSS